MAKKKIAEEWLKVTESMNNLNVDLGARFKEDPEALFKAFGENNPEAGKEAKRLARLKKVAETEMHQTIQEIVSGKRIVPVTYENPSFDSLSGDAAEILRIKWDSGMDYQPHVPFFQHYSAWMLNFYKGNYTQFMAEVSKLNPAELKKKLEMRETLFCVGAVFHTVIGARSLVPESEFFQPTIRLHGTAELEHLMILEKLIELGADVVNSRDMAGFTPLHHCLTGQGNPVTYQMAKLLLENGANPNAPTRFGLVPLTICVMAGDLERAKLLIKHGADPHVKDYDGVSPLMCASMYPAMLTVLKKGEKCSVGKQRVLAKEQNLLKKCGLCKKTGEKRCTGCFLEWYCGADCQKTDWTNHKVVCKQRRKEYLPVKFSKQSACISGFNYQTSKVEVSIKGPIKKPKATSFVVKVQVPLDSGPSSLLAVYNKDRSVYGLVDEKDDAGAQLAKAVRTKGFNLQKGYFCAIMEEDKVLINPTILPPETW